MEFPARVVCEGSFPEDRVRVSVVEDPLPPDIADQVDEFWARELVHNPHLRPWPLLCARFVEVVNGAIQLECVHSNYKEFMGTTRNVDIPERYRRRAVGFLAVTTTGDYRILLGVRNRRIDWGTLWHVVPAGRLKPSEGNPHGGIRAEFREELGLDESDLINLECIGVVADETWGRLNYEFVFIAATQFTAWEVMKRAEHAKSADEHIQLVPYSLADEYLASFLLTASQCFVPTGFAGLVLALRHLHQDFVPSWTPVHRTYEEHMGLRLALLQK